MSIDVVLGVEGLRTLRREIEARTQVFRQVIDEIAKELATLGYVYMEYHAPQHDVDGNIRGEIVIEQRNDGYAVTFRGDDVAYIEFGTGVVGEGLYPDHEAIAMVDWVYDINDHGAKGWFYYDKRFLPQKVVRYSRGGARPQAPVYKAFKDTEKQVANVVERVLRDKFGR